MINNNQKQSPTFITTQTTVHQHAVTQPIATRVYSLPVTASHSALHTPLRAQSIYSLDGLDDTLSIGEILAQGGPGTKTPSVISESFTPSSHVGRFHECFEPYDTQSLSDSQSVSDSAKPGVEQSYRAERQLPKTFQALGFGDPAVADAMPLMQRLALMAQAGLSCLAFAVIIVIATPVALFYILESAVILVGKKSYTGAKDFLFPKPCEVAQADLDVLSELSASKDA